jgi:hypothetical protein
MDLNRRIYSLLLLCLLAAGCTYGGGTSSVQPVLNLTQTPRAFVTPRPTQRLPFPTERLDSHPLSPLEAVQPQPAAPTLVPNEAWYRPAAADVEGLPIGYVKVINPPAEIYPTLEKAVLHSVVPRHSAVVPTYLSFLQVENVDGKPFYQVEPNGWVDGANLEEVHIPTFSGLELDGGIDFAFAWVLEDTSGQNEQGEALNEPFSRYQVVKILSESAGRYEVSPGIWLPADKLSLVKPGQAAPKEASSCRWIQVNLQQQNLLVFDDCMPIFATLISSGREIGWTETGVYRIYAKLDKHVLTNPTWNPELEPYYFQDVPWIMYYHSSWALHGVYWHTEFGHPASHGCVNLSPADAHWIFNWAKPSEVVFITE